MRIGVDCRVLSRARSGIGLSLENILLGLQRMDSGHSFHLFSNRDFRLPIFNSRFVKVIDSRLSRMPGTLWLQTVLPGHLSRLRIDAFWGFEHIIPLWSPCSTVLNINDLTYVHYPGTMTRTSYLMNRLFIPACVRRCRGLVAISEYTWRTLTDRFPFLNERAKRVIPLAGTLGDTISSDRNTVFSKFGLSSPYILSVGSFEPRKNLPALIRAYSDLREPNLGLVLVGVSAWKSEELLRLQRELPENVVSRIRMLRGISREDLKCLYSNALLFVFPSLFEGFGIPVVEAMECGVPVLCSNTSSLPEIGGNAVCYFNPLDPDELSSKIRFIADSPGKRTELVHAGLERAKLFNWNRTAKMWLNVFRDLEEPRGFPS